MIPVMLYIFQLQHSGWQWPHAALFGSMLASTDAVAIVATMKSSEYASAPLGILRCDRLQSILSALLVVAVVATMKSSEYASSFSLGLVLWQIAMVAIRTDPVVIVATMESSEFFLWFLCNTLTSCNISSVLSQIPLCTTVGIA